MCKLVIIKKKSEGKRMNKNKCFIVNLHRAWMHASVYKSYKSVTHMCIYMYRYGQQICLLHATNKNIIGLKSIYSRSCRMVPF